MSGAAAAPGRVADPLALLGWLAASAAAGAAGAIASTGSPEFYAALDRPAWAPPASVFGPVWSVLYVMMGIAAWLVARERSGAHAGPRRAGLTLFAVQLVLNALWTWLFFRWRLGGIAFAELVLLGIVVLATALLFSRVRRLAGWLLVPYLAWLAYAGALNLALWRSNPGLL